MRQVEIRHRRRFTRGHYNYHFNPVVRYRGKDYELELGAGSDDYEYAYMDGTDVYVLVVNRRLPYVGLTRFALGSEATAVDDSEAGTIYVWMPAGEIFLQEGQVYEVLGPRGTDLAERTMLRRLLPYLD